jgi:hypothetical protein
MAISASPPTKFDGKIIYDIGQDNKNMKLEQRSEPTVSDLSQSALRTKFRYGSQFIILESPTGNMP